MPITGYEHFQEHQPAVTLWKAKTMNKQLLRVGEAAQALNVSRWTIYRWVEEDRLKATKIGKGSLRIFRDSIDALIQQNRKDHWDLPLTKWR